MTSVHNSFNCLSNSANNVSVVRNLALPGHYPLLTCFELLNAMTDEAAAAAVSEAASNPEPTAAGATQAAFPHPDAAKKVEEAATKASADVEAKALPVRQWLEQHIVPTIYQGMMAAAKERPEDPVEYLAAYLLEHNPKKKQKTGKEAS